MLRTAFLPWLPSSSIIFHHLPSSSIIFARAGLLQNQVFSYLHPGLPIISRRILQKPWGHGAMGPWGHGAMEPWSQERSQANTTDLGTVKQHSSVILCPASIHLTPSTHWSSIRVLISLFVEFPLHMDVCDAELLGSRELLTSESGRAHSFFPWFHPTASNDEAQRSMQLTRRIFAARP